MKKASFLSFLSAATMWLVASCRTAPPTENYLPVSKGTGGTRPGPGGGVGGTGIGPGAGGAMTILGGEGGELPASGGASSGTGGVSGTGARPSTHSGGTNGGGPPTSGGGAAGPSGGGDPGPTGGAGPTPECPLPAASSASFSRQELRKAAAACAAWAACEFEVAARALPREIDVDSPDPARSKQAFYQAMVRWSWVEAMQFGPVAPPSEVAGRDTYHGKGYRDLVHAWPQVTRCRVDEQVAGKRYETFGMDVVPISGRGLYGIETLLYYEGLDTGCTPTSTTGQSWAAFDAAQITTLRHRYARALARDVYARSEIIRDVWLPSGEDFSAKFEAAEGYPSEQEAMNVLGWALLYLEREVKDFKLGIPAGYTVGAPVSEPEVQYSGIQMDLLRANVAGFRAIFQGCSEGNAGVGFDDWLVSAGHPELAADVVNATEALQQKLATLPQFSALTPTELEETYLAVKLVTDYLKGDLFGAGSPLNLKLPAGLEGDTD